MFYAMWKSSYVLQKFGKWFYEKVSNCKHLKFHEK